MTPSGPPVKSHVPVVRMPLWMSRQYLHDPRRPGSPAKTHANCCTVRASRRTSVSTAVLETTSNIGYTSKETVAFVASGENLGLWRSGTDTAGEQEAECCG